MKYYHLNSKYELEYYKKELIRLNNKEMNLGEMQKYMRNKYSKVSGLALVRLCELFVQNISLTLLKSINNKYIAILDILKSSALATDLKNNLGKGVV